MNNTALFYLANLVVAGWFYGKKYCIINVYAKAPKIKNFNY